MTAWLSQVFSHPGMGAVAAIAAKTAIIYLCVVVGLRLLGSRELGEMTAYDFVLVVVIANAVQNALVGGDTTLAGGLVSAIVLLLANRAFTWLLNRSHWLERQMIGEPVVIVSDGHMHWKRMQREGLTRDEVMAGLREHGIASLDDVRMVVLEVDGSISVIPKQATVHRVRRHIKGLRTS